MSTQAFPFTFRQLLSRDDPSKDPVVRWRSSGNLFFANWINYIVYQTTPYDLEQLQIVKEFIKNKSAQDHTAEK